jgi:hypothetical protein
MSTGCADAYACSGLNTGAGGGPSENWTNWHGFDNNNGVTGVTSFTIFAFAIDYALNSDPGTKHKPKVVNSPINIDFASATQGSFVIAYNCAVTGTSCTDGDIGETPFTNAGADNTNAPPRVPEPASMALLGTALVGAYGLLRRKLSE